MCIICFIVVEVIMAGTMAQAIRTRAARADVFKTKAIIKNPTCDYSLFEYVRNSTKGEIICPKGHHFFQSPAEHLKSKGTGCKLCPQPDALSTEEFITRSEATHGKGTFDYSNTVYFNARTLVSIKCQNGHEFEQLPFSHMNGSGCRFCAYESDLVGFSLKSRIKYSKEVHNGLDCLYVIRLYSDTESFYKIGITFNPYNRFQYIKTTSKYSLEVLFIVQSKCDLIWKLEKKLHKLYEQSKYSPTVEFQGSKLECFSDIRDICSHIPSDTFPKVKKFSYKGVIHCEND